MAVLVADTFTRADSTTVVGASETGAVTPTQHAGTWGISSNRLYTPTQTSSHSLISWECGTPNVDITLDIPVSHSGQNDGIAFLVNSATDYWRLVPASNATSSWYLSKQGATTTTNSIVAFFGLVAGSSTTPTGLRVVHYNGEVAVYFGATLLGRCDISQYGPVTATKHGVWSQFNTSSRYDNLSISDSSAIAHANSSVFAYKGRDTKTSDTGSVA